MVEENGAMEDQPPRFSPQVADVLEHLASIDLLELCNEAKVERCRATRDLSSCGRYVQDVLTSCGHASLCAECSKRCDMCPICRTSIPINGNRLRPRLYYECANVGLISKKYVERFQEKDDSKDHLMAIQRLCSLFDVALDNNLVSLICHYVTDVCMDENAVSSDPGLSFLLDEVVVKDWCKQRFKGIIHELEVVYRLDLEGMRTKLYSLQKWTSHLIGISDVLDVMVSSFKDNLSAQLSDLHFLLDNMLKTKQHLEIMIWCIQHNFLENVRSSYADNQSWAVHVQKRKAAVIKHSWPDNSSYLQYYGGRPDPDLFIEQALSNLQIEDNVIFLYGASDMVVAKRAIFLYYLFDRHWASQDAEWKNLVDDFAVCFGIGSLPVLESLVFYLLDDHTDQALQEACRLLPEIVGAETHPKIAQILLERQCPDVALTVLRCSGCDGYRKYYNFEDDGVQPLSIDEALTILRVRIECGQLTEAFMFQRIHCSDLEGFTSQAQDLSPSNTVKSGLWIHHMEILITEICSLCLRRNLIDRMVELPWDSMEEKFIHKFLFDCARQNPSSIYGSLLMVFYLQRYRYVEAYQVHCELKSLEKVFLDNSDEGIANQITKTHYWRSVLVDKSLDLLPEVQRKQVLTGSPTESDFPSLGQDDQMVLHSTPELHQKLADTTVKSTSLVLPNDLNLPFKRPVSETPIKQYSSVGVVHRVSPRKAVASGFSQEFLSSSGHLENGSLLMPLKELHRSPQLMPSCEPRMMRSYDSMTYVGNADMHSTSVTSQHNIDILKFSNNQSFLRDAVRDQPFKSLGKHSLLASALGTVTPEESTQKVQSFGSGIKLGSLWNSGESRDFNLGNPSSNRRRQFVRTRKARRDR
ncbi:hypothetical protein HPP92_002289 [Vanilla planifolia]|uniref:RING-type domain-containing protein n=1 Tax=Vanilla planifolia TaxID=51239 RepID=A0A835SEF8_VANPL|nr:hypothetical protein HPP92_002289 [Vanilla planifolia]